MGLGLLARGWQRARLGEARFNNYDGRCNTWAGCDLTLDGTGPAPVAAPVLRVQDYSPGLELSLFVGDTLVAGPAQ